MSQTHDARITAIPLRGGHIALDFVNTAGWHASDAPSEWLESYTDLALWADRAGLHTSAESMHLVAAAGRSPRDAERVRQRAIAFREALYRICGAFLQATLAEEADLEIVRSTYLDALAHSRFAQTGEGFALGWDQAAPPLDAPLWRLAIAATDFLQSDDLARTRQCGSAPCGWLFVDRSKNHSRRWCSSEECGNRERVKRHLARQ
ncbi:MAG: CGNR zinc finger domain-containing protein [bacterium]